MNRPRADPPFRCTADTHRCNTLALAFFALWHGGDLDALTLAAVAQCREGRE